MKLYPRSLAGALIVPALVIAAMTVPATSAHADERVCRGSIGAVTLDNVRVPDNATCTLNGTEIEGTLKVESNAKLVAVNVDVDGNVQAENARRVVIRGDSTVGGSVQLKQGDSARVVRTSINGDLQYESNDSSLAALSNNVGGNIQVVQNTGGVEIRKNRVDGNLQCKQNVPAPVGGGNIVEGSKEGQCSNL